jgi:hypothetical protein
MLNHAFLGLQSLVVISDLHTLTCDCEIREHDFSEGKIPCVERTTLLDDTRFTRVRNEVTETFSLREKVMDPSGLSVCPTSP